MSRKLVVGLAVIGVWFFVIALFGFYYLFVSDTTLKIIQIQDEHYQTPTVKKEINTPKKELEGVSAIDTDKEEKAGSTNLELKGGPPSFTFKNNELADVKTEKPTEAIVDEKKNEVISKTNDKEEVGGFEVRGHILSNQENKPIENASVDIYTGDANFIKRVVTDKNGAFEASHIKGDMFQIRVSKEHFVSLSLKNYTKAQLKEHLLLKMDSGNKISGLVRNKETQALLEGVSVDLYRGSILVKKSVLTDETGKFTVETVPAGQFDLVFSKSGFSSVTQPIAIEKKDIQDIQIVLDKSSSLTIEVVTKDGFVEIPRIRVYFDGAKEPLHYERSILGDDATRNIYRISGLEKQYSRLRIHAFGFTYPTEKQIKIEPGKETTVTFEVNLGITVSGYVHDAENRPLKNVSFEVYEVFGGGRAMSDDVLKGKVITDDSGKFSISGITKGNIEFILVSTVYKRYRQIFSVAEENNSDFDIALEVESYFLATVKEKNGTVVNVSDVRMTPIKEDGTYDATRDRPIFGGNTNDGHVQISGVVPGLYRLSISANGYSVLINENYFVKANQLNDMFIMEKGLSVTGETKTASGVAVASCEVEFSAIIKGNIVRFRSVTDGNGYFAVQGLEDGVSYKLQAQAKGFKLLEQNVEIKPSSNFFNLTLEKKNFYSGVVLDNNSRVPIQNFQVKIFAKLGQGLLNDNIESFNTGNGQFSMPTNADTFDLEIIAPGYAQYLVKNVNIVDPVRNHFLTRAGSLSFVVKSQNNTFASMAQIFVSKFRNIDNDENKKSLRTDSNGVAFLQNLEPGEYYIRVIGVMGCANHDDIVVVREGQDSKKEIQMIPGLTLRGRVLALNNIPISIGEVYLDNDRYTKIAYKTIINRDGFFEFKNINVGAHRLSIYYGPMVNSKFSVQMDVVIDVPEIVNNENGIYQINDIRVP